MCIILGVEPVTLCTEVWQSEEEVSSRALLGLRLMVLFWEVTELLGCVPC